MRTQLAHIRNFFFVVSIHLNVSCIYCVKYTSISFYGSEANGCYLDFLIFSVKFRYLRCFRFVFITCCDLREDTQFCPVQSFLYRKSFTNGCKQISLMSNTKLFQYKKKKFWQNWVRSKWCLSALQNSSYINNFRNMFINLWVPLCTSN